MSRPVRGTVLGADGRPVAGAAVMVERGTAPTPEVARRTDDRGRFRLALPPGGFTISAHVPDGRSGSVDLAVGEQEATANLTIMIR